MTEAQELMLAACFGSFLGIQIFNVGFIIKFVIDTVREKKQKRKEDAEEAVQDTTEE